MDNQFHFRISHYADTIFEHMPVGVALYDTQDLCLLAANTLMLKFFDANLAPLWRNGQVLGHPITDWLPEAIAPSLVAICHTVIETGAPFQISEFSFPFAEQGTTYWNWTLDPVCDADGHVIQLLQTVNEITRQVLARQQTEEAHAALSKTNSEVEAERKRLEVIETVARSVRESLDIQDIGREAVNVIYSCFSPLHVGIHIDDPVHRALRLLDVRPIPDTEQVLRFVQHVPYDSPLLVVQAHQSRNPIVVEDLQVAVASGTIDRNNPGPSLGIHGYICVPLWFKDYFEGTITAAFSDTIHANSPEVQTLVGCSVHIAAALAHARLHAGIEQDISERKSIEQHKNAFLSIASHELRTPVTAIQGFAELLQLQAGQQGSLNSLRILRAITGITEQSERLTQLIEEMLDISRIENARLRLNPAQHDLLKTLHHVIESQTITSKHHHLQLVLEGLKPTDTLIGSFDENRIVQVLNNLVSNAIKYSPAGSEIEIGLRHTPNAEALIWVKDAGIGIGANELPHIFERFHRARNLDRSISGLGIGLYLVNELVTRHGGRVWAESVEGKGSTFYILLPL